MASVFRDFDINIPNRGNLGNIDISFIEEGVLCVIVFGLNCGYRFVHMRVKYPTHLCLYNVCISILDKITKDFELITYEGYVQYMRIEDYKIDISLDKELLEVVRSNYNFPTFEFNKNNIKYLKKYNLDFDFNLDTSYRLIESEVTEDYKFIYNFESLLHYDDDMEWVIPGK